MIWSGGRPWGSGLAKAWGACVQDGQVGGLASDDRTLPSWERMGVNAGCFVFRVQGILMCFFFLIKIIYNKMWPLDIIGYHWM